MAGAGEPKNPYEGWSRDALLGQERGLADQLRQTIKPKKREAVQEKLDQVRAALVAAGHVATAPTPTPKVAAPAPTIRPSVPAPTAPAAQGRGPMGPVGPELEILLDAGAEL